jgi:hypothetical protein
MVIGVAVAALAGGIWAFWALASRTSAATDQLAETLEPLERLFAMADKEGGFEPAQFVKTRALEHAEELRSVTRAFPAGRVREYCDVVLRSVADAWSLAHTASTAQVQTGNVVLAFDLDHDRALAARENEVAVAGLAAILLIRADSPPRHQPRINVPSAADRRGLRAIAPSAASSWEAANARRSHRGSPTS